MVPKRFFDQACLQAVSYTTKDFKLSKIREYVSSKSIRHIIKIKEVSVAYDMSVSDKEHISLFIFMIAYIERYNTAVTVTELLRRTNDQRGFSQKYSLTLA